MNATTSKVSGSLKILRFDIPNVAKSTETADIVLSLSDYKKEIGYISAVNVICASEDFDISLREESGVTRPSIKERYRVEEIELFDYEPNANAEFINSGSLYCTITNDDASNDTGVISLEITLQ